MSNIPFSTSVSGYPLLPSFGTAFVSIRAMLSRETFFNFYYAIDYAID
jgi:hypothetical protein